MARPEININGVQAQIGHGGTIPKETVLPPINTAYMGKDWMAVKLGARPEGTTIYRGEEHVIIQNGQEVTIG